MQFVSWNCDGCTIALLIDYANNEVYQELVRKDKHLVSFDEKLYLDLRRNKSYTDELENLQTISI